MMASSTATSCHQLFYDERGTILRDIDQFLSMVLRFSTKVKDGLNEDFDEDHQKLHPLVTSLSLIHGLYGYPALNGTHDTGNKDAVKENFRGIEFHGKTFGDIFPNINGDEGFWKFDFGNKQLRDLPREPAHLFLELVREIFAGNNHAAEFGKLYLEQLPDVNKLKPAVWATHESKPGLFGVSLGVRQCVRPLFLYIKLVDLLDNNSNRSSCLLSEVRAFENIKRNLLEKDSSRCSGYEQYKEPCLSCRLFFSVVEVPPKVPSLSPFGNCAEYDVIQTGNLNSLLHPGLDYWEEFESACQIHFQAFKNHIHPCAIETDTINKYIQEMTKKAKILQYERIGPSFTLTAKDWLKRRPNRKRKRKS